MTVAELVALLGKRDPSEVVVLGFYERHGDSEYRVAEDQARDISIEWQGEPCSGVLLGAVAQDEVEPESID